MDGTAAWPEANEDDITRVYLAMIRVPRPTRELLLAQGIPASRLDPALETLAVRGLVGLASDGTIDVPPPMSALPQHALQLERQASAARAAADELSTVYYAARAQELDPVTGVEVLADLAEVGAATNQAVALATVAVRSLRGMTARSRQVMDSPLASHREPSVGLGGRVVAMQTVWDAGILELPGALDALAARAEGGETQRFLGGVPISIIVVDDTTCIVEWSGSGGGPQGLLGHAPGAVGAATALFERFWQLAMPMGRRGDDGDLPDGEGREFDSRDEAVLRLLAAGVADAAIARQTGFSQRTVERRVRALMERLGARTRFQAGVQAVHRGWL